MKKSFIINKYLYIIGKNFFSWLLIITSGLSYYGLLSLFSFFPIQQSEFLCIFTPALLISFIIQEAMLGRLTDPVDAFILNEQPIVRVIPKSLMLLFLNFVGTSPIFGFISATFLLLAPYPENILIIIYIFMLGSAILALSLNYNYSIIFSILGSLLSLLVRTWSLSLLLSLIALLIVPTYMILRQLPNMPSIITLKKFGFTTLYLQPITQCAILLLLAVTLMKTFFFQKSIYGIISPYESGFISTNFPFDILEALLVNTVVVTGQLTPILINLTARYIDSHLWYIRVIKRIPIKMRFLNFMSTILIGLIVPALMLTILNLLNVVEAKWITLLCSTGVFTGTLTLTKFERKSEAIIPLVIYFFIPLILYPCITVFLTLPSIGGLSLQLSLQELLNNIFLPMLLIVLAIYLYELPLKIKLLLIRKGIIHE